MAAVCSMDEEKMVAELIEGLINEISALKTYIGKLPTQTPIDYQPSIEALTEAVQALQNQPKPVPTAVDLSPITGRIDRLEQLVRQRPEHKLSQYVRYGGYCFGLMVVLLVVATWLALDWKGERDGYQQAYARDNWRVRYTEQANPDYYAYMEGIFSKEPAKVYQWVEEQEQADQKRALAKEAAEQAKALSRQANELEGKGKKR